MKIIYVGEIDIGFEFQALLADGLFNFLIAPESTSPRENCSIKLEVDLI
jgi:hypothetical protein